MKDFWLAGNTNILLSDGSNKLISEIVDKKIERILK